MAWCSVAFAIEVNVTEPGTLGKLVEDKDATQLVVSGVIDARDLLFITEDMNLLEGVDLSEAQIVAYSGTEPCFADVLDYEADAIPAYCFFDKKYTSVVLPSGLKRIGEAAFAGCNRLEAVTFPTSLESIGRYAFSACEAISAVVLPGSVTNIESGAFSRCDALKTADLSALSASCEWGVNLFTDCKALESVNIGSNATKISAGAFSGCGALKTVTLGDNPALVSIGEEAFASTGLTSFDFVSCSGLNVIGRWAFAGVALSEAVLPASVETIGEGAFFCNKALSGIALPSSVTEVNDFVLSGCGALSSVTLSEGTTTVGRYALGNTQMTTLQLPASLTYVGDRAMEDNTALVSIDVLAETVPELGEDVFAGIDQSSVTLTVPDGSILLYQTADQWKEFRIEGDLSTLEESLRTDAIRVYFEDRVLCVEANVDIEGLNVYEPGGVQVVSTNPRASSVRIDMSAMGGKLYIVTVRLGSGKIKTVKLLRK